MKVLELNKLERLNERIGEEVVVEFTDLEDDTSNPILGEFDYKITEDKVILIDNENEDNNLYININKIIEIEEHDDHLEVVTTEGVYNIF